MLSTGIREPLKSLDSSVPGPEPGQPHRMRGALAVAQEREAVEGLKPAIVAVGEGLKPAIAVVAEAVKVA